MKRWWSGGVRLWLFVSLSGCLSAVAIEPGRAEFQPRVEQQQVQSQKNLKPLLSREIRQLGETERPSTSSQHLVQTPAPSKPPNLGGKQGGVIEVTGVQANPTDKGVELILQTTQGKALQPVTFALGRAYIANIPNAQLRLPSGDAFTFRSPNPVSGLTKITVTNIDANTIRVTVAGEQELPTVELLDSQAGLIFALTPAAVATQPAPTPQAEPSAPQDEQREIVVTGEREEGYRVPDTSVGTRTDTPLRDIPQSIQIVPQEVLRDQNATNIVEALRNVPGVTQDLTSRELSSGFIIRGFVNDARRGSNFLRNGLRETGISFSELTPNIERIEVLKGPASVLYGQATPGGTINQVTKQPLRDPFYNIDATIGSYDFYEGAIDLSGPLNDSKTVLYRLNAAYQDQGSFVDFYNLRQFAVAPVVSFALGERTRFTLESEYIDLSLVLPINLPAVGTVLPNPNGKIPRNRNINEPDGSQDATFSRVGYRLEHQFSDNWSLQQAFQWRTINRNSDIYTFFDSLDADNRTLNRTAARFNNDADVYDLNVNLTGKFTTGSIEHQLVFGVDLGRLEERDEFLTGTAAPLDLFNPVYGQPFGELARNSDTDFSQDTLGIYLQDQVTLAENLKLLLGGRFDLFEQTNQDFLADTKPVSRGMPSLRVWGLFISQSNPFLSMPATAARLTHSKVPVLRGTCLNPNAAPSMKWESRQISMTNFRQPWRSTN